jgi:adenylate kinase
MFNLVIFGPPGAGKGTQSDKIIDKFNLLHCSTGDMFRSHISNKTALGQKVQSILDAGELVPDAITIEMLEDRLSSNQGVRGFIYDGFPRTVNQAEALDAFLAEKEQKIDLVIKLDVTQEEIKQRIAERFKVSNRADDDATKLIKRIEEYFNKTVHVVPFYEAQNKVVSINGIGKIEDIFAEITTAIDQAWSK